MTVADILMLVFGIVVIVVGVPILLCIVGVLMIGLVLGILESLPDNFL